MTQWVAPPPALGSLALRLIPRLKGKTVARARTLLRRADCALGRVAHGHSRLRVVDVVPFEEADELGFVGMLKVEAV